MQEAIDTQNLFLLSSVIIGCQSKPKRDNFISQIFFVCGRQKTSRPEQKANRRTATEPTEKAGMKMMRKKKKHRQREREKKNIRHMCGKGNLHSRMFHWI